MNSYDHNSDHLKLLSRITEPDPRKRFFQVFDPENQNTREIKIEDHYAEVSRYTLPPSVPEKIVTHFETAKNLYLYSWYVYRFHPVADLHAKTTLELALKMRIGEDNLKAACKSVNMGKGLKGYILYAIGQGWVTNEGFEGWWHQAHMRARQRVVHEGINEMQRSGLESLDIGENNIEIIDEDKDFDLLATLAESIPALRNEYANGSNALFGKTFRTLEIVSEFIGQVWCRV